MGFFKKEMNFTTSKSLNDIVSQFGQFLQNQRWKVQSNVQGDKAVMQAQKPGILRDLVAADRALTFTFDATAPGQLQVTTGVGKVLKNLAITAIETLLLSEIFVVVDIPEILFTEHVEKELLTQLQAIAQ
ncbi:MAG: hypothetical protein B2I17_04060 [Thermoplasmatales archaeon B_DKE]|nr:MAG: hypothetical protein B2I17_04060 [Thermoplasmatales archaeon B_DKE]